MNRHRSIDTDGKTNLNLYEEVSRPRRASLPLAPHAHAQAGVDAGRDVDVYATRAVGPSPGDSLGAPLGHFFKVKPHRRLYERKIPGLRCHAATK